MPWVMRQRYGEEAAVTFRHYFANEWANYSVFLPKLLSDVPLVNGLFDELIAHVKIAVTARSPGVHIFAMLKAESFSVERLESDNWYLAVDGFSHRINGSLEVSGGDSVRGTSRLHFWDRHDWDPGVVIPVSTPFGRIDIDQGRVGDVHRQGLAPETDTVGSADIQVK